MKAYDGLQIVGIDLHRRRSVLVRMTEDSTRLGTANYDAVNTRILAMPAAYAAAAGSAPATWQFLGRYPAPTDTVRESAGAPANGLMNISGGHRVS